MDLEKVNILEQINILKDNNSNMFENIDELISNKEAMNEKINGFDEKVEQLKNEQLKDNFPKQNLYVLLLFGKKHKIWKKNLIN